MEQLKHVLSIQPSPQATPKAGTNVISRTVGESRVVTSELASIIQETDDAERLEELLNVNDQLLNLLKKVPGPGKPILTLQSLDIAFKNTSSRDGKLDGTPHINGQPSDRGEQSSEASSVDGFEDSPTTPKTDKGEERRDLKQELRKFLVQGSVLTIRRMRMRMLLRYRGPLIGKIFFLGGKHYL